MHGVAVDDYHKLFPGAYMMSAELKQRISEAEVGKVVGEEARQKMSEAQIGNTHALGFRQTEEARQRMSESKRGREVSEETRQRISMSLQGRVMSEETKQRRSESQRGLWRSPEYARMMSEAQHRKPNGCELQLLSVLDKYFPSEWKYTGDGKDKEDWIGGRNPDFMGVNGKKQVIEVFGYYYHSPCYFPNRPTEEELIAHYKSYGYSCIVFWEYDVYNGEEVVERLRGVSK